MNLGKIIGTVVATRKDEALVGTKMLIVQQVNLDEEPLGTPFVAVDTVGAGVGEWVLYVSGSVAPFALRKGDVPVDASIVGIVDHLEYQRE
jgi:ethanolamine utilization protein EutN